MVSLRYMLINVFIDENCLCVVFGNNVKIPTTHTQGMSKFVKGCPVSRAAASDGQAHKSRITTISKVSTASMS